MLRLGYGMALDKLKIKCIERGVTLMILSKAYTEYGSFYKCNNDRIYHCNCGHDINRDLLQGGSHRIYH